MTTYHYNGLTASVIGGGKGEAERRMVSWQQQDQLGRTTLLRTYTPDDDEWSLEAEISRAYDTADRLTEVYRRDGGQRRWEQTSSIHYDFVGRKTSMHDADLGSWSYDYNTLGQLTRQTDARDNTSCLYYDSLGRMRGRVQGANANCAASVADADLDASYSYDSKGRVQSVSNDLVSRTFSYDSYSRLNSESVTIDSRTRSSSYSYDSYQRPATVTYHGGEVVSTSYGSPGVAVGLRSSIHGDLVDNVSYDEAGRMTAMRFPAGGALWRTQSYYDWSVRRNGGMLQSLKVGRNQGSSENLNRSYAYNSLGDLSALTEDTTSYAFSYDGLGRLTAAYGRTYSYDGANRLTAFNGQSYGYGDAGPYHAVDRIGNADRFDYDANGNMTKRDKGLDSQQTLVWNSENRLSEVQDNNGNLIESYWYDIGGARVKKVSGATTTYTFFGHYEEEVTNGVTTAISHYSFGSLRIAVKRGSALYHLHGDHLGSTSLTTLSSTSVASRAYYAYGSERSASGDLQTDRTFTGQKSDATGLLYYNARYYDPALGTFISPDSLVPDPGRVINFNRFLYAKGNPLKYTDPSGHCGISYQNGTGAPTISKFNCTVTDFQRLSWEERKLWVELIVDEEKLDRWLKDIYEAIIHLSNDPDFKKMSGWAAQMDAGILQAINDGVLLHRGQKPIGTPKLRYGLFPKRWHGGAKWHEFLELVGDGFDEKDIDRKNEIIRIRYQAEQEGVDYSGDLPETQKRKDEADFMLKRKIDLFLIGANAYRLIADNCRRFRSCDNPYTDPRTAVDETFVGQMASWPEYLTRPFRETPKPY